MKKGLTLVEVLVAAAIFSFISVSLYLLLQTAISVRKKVEAKQAGSQHVNLVLEKIAQQLRNIVFFTKEDSGFKGYPEGDSKVLEFYTLMFDYVDNYPKISHVKYRFAGTLLYRQVRGPFSEESDSEVEVMDNLKSFEVLYFDAEGNEMQEWIEDDLLNQIPKGLKISLEYSDEKEKVQAAQKHIFIYRHNKYEPS
ncbi:MAG: prepilin-type N-terminal cleavage/methylation domain-containing protein [Candidatus Omnitrophota bacterium]|nr:MAG: prepilin-type N-terminal cleavage/methylation domain-containing protein [Candidatus Omnitrophota bacterium]